MSHENNGNENFNAINAMKIKRLSGFILTLFCIMTASASPLKDGKFLQGFVEKVSGDDATFESHIPGVREAMVIRSAGRAPQQQTERAVARTPQQPAEWFGQQPDAATTGTVHFVFAAALSNVVPGRTGVPDRPSPDFNFYLNDEKIVTFQIGREANWTAKGLKQSELSFEQCSIGVRESRLGYLFLSIPVKNLPQGTPVKFRIDCTSEGFNNSVMIFKTPVEHKIMDITALPVILNKTSKQIVKVYYSHLGKPSQVQVEWNGVKQKENARFGINVFELAIDAVKQKTTGELKITGKEAPVTKAFDLLPVREWQVMFVQHTHTDIGYTRPQHEILSEHIRFIDYALDYCDLTDDYPDDAKFRWVCEAAWAVSEYIRIRPKEQVERLKQRIKEGRIEVTAMYFNYDELPGEQELAYSLYTLREFKKNGIPVQTAMQNDVNGIAWSFAEFFPDLGVKYIVMGTHGHKALISFDKPTAFWWESPSGKKTLTFRAEHYMYGNFLQLERGDFAAFERLMLNYLNSMEELKYPHDVINLQYSGYSTDNSPPSTVGSDMVRQWNEKYTFPKMRMSVSSDFMQAIEQKYGKDLQTYRAAWPDWWTDGFGSAAREAATARYAQADIISNQISLSLARILGADLSPTVNRELDEVNKALLFYGEHTFGFHNSVRDPFNLETMEQRSHKAAYAWEAYRRSRPVGETALGLLQTYAPRQKDKAGIIVFNPLNWEHTGYTVIYADHEVLPVNRKTIIKDEKGVEVKKQIIRSYADASYWALWVEKAPALGSKYYTIQVTNENQPVATTNNSPVETIENQWYRISFDLTNGVVTEWFDKELDKNLLTEGAKWKMGELVYERDDVRGALDRYMPGNFERFSPTDVSYLGSQEGAIWDSYRFRGTSPAGMGTNNFTFELRLYKTCKQVDFTYRLRKKQETEPEALYVVFPFELNRGKIYFDVPGGTIEAGVEQIPGSTNDWNTVQNFASVRNSAEQIVIGSREIPLMQFGNINLGRFKAGATPETNHIFTWPMNNYWVTNFNADQHGEFEWTYSLTSSGDPSIEYATKFAWNNRIPLPNRVIPAGLSNNKPPINGSILSLNPSNVLLVNMTPIEGENALMLQLREIGGKDSALDITSTFAPAIRVKECNPLGEEQPTGATIRIKAWENKFVKIQL